MAYYKQFLSIDPGMSTGIVLWHSLWGGPFIRHEYWQIAGGLEGFIAFISKDGVPAIVEDLDISFAVCEQFIPDGRASKLQEFEPLRIEGYIRGLFPCEWDIHWQRNSAMKGVTDRKLKQHDLWVTGTDVGMPDANDVISATKHGLAWLKANHAPSRDFYWKDDE